MKIILILLAMLSFSAFAQNGQKGNEDFFKALREQMKNDRADMEKYFQGDFIDRMDKMIEDMQNDFFNQYDQLLKDDQWGDLFKQMELGVEDVPMHWEDKKTGKTLVVEIVPMKDAPLEINIENQMVSLKGTIEKSEESKGKKNKVISKRIYTFHQNVAIPEELNSKTAEIEQKKDRIEISFQFKKGKQIKKQVEKKPTQSKEIKKDVTPLNPGEGDIDL